MKACGSELCQKAIDDAGRIGLVKSARLNHISPQSLVTWCHAKGISFKRQGHQKPCAICGELFTCRLNSNRVCCSTSCRRIFNHETRYCPTCGKPFTVIKSKVQKYCSHACYAMTNRKDIREPKRRGCNWNTIRRMFKRTPQLCGVCKTVLATDIHHIIPFKYFQGDWQRANDESNRIPLCHGCHVKVENYVRKVFRLISLMEQM